MNRTDKVDNRSSGFYILGIFPRCPFYNSFVAVSIILVLIAFGTIGIYFLNRSLAIAYLVYSISWYFLAMPFVMCKYCYFNLKETTTHQATGKTVDVLMPIHRWREIDGIAKHASRGKKTTIFMAVIWLAPLVLISMSFFRGFSFFALLALIAFAIVLVGNYYYMLRVKCPTCAIKDECHAAF